VWLFAPGSLRTVLRAPTFDQDWGNQQAVQKGEVMKSAISRFLIVAAITGLLLVAGSTGAWAQSPNYPNFNTNQNLIKLNGNNPSFVVTDSGPTLLRLTPNVGNSVASAWFTAAQPVVNGFTTSFTFQITNPSNPPADGIVFVIQNSSAGLGAIGYSGGNGGALGYGDDDANQNPSTGEGIANSIAIEFDTYTNGWDRSNNNHIAIQSCGSGNNTSHHDYLCQGTTGPDSTLGFFPVSTPTFADGNPHTVTITYTPPSSDAPSGSGSLQVKLDTNDPVSVAVNLSTLLSLTNGGAYVGFTAATGGSVETQDILSWTYQAQALPDQTTIFTFPNHTFEVTPAGDQTGTTVQVKPILKSQSDCNALVQANPLFKGTDTIPATQCFVYKNADGLGGDFSVMYEVTCPNLPNGACTPFDTDLGTSYDLSILPGNNTGYNPGNPLAGFLRADGGQPGAPCALPASGNLFDNATNQVSAFESGTSDPTTHGKSGGTGSCWTGTYNTQGEAPSVAIAAPINNFNYQQNQVTAASYACHAVNNSSVGTGVNGPYLTVSSCSATDSPGGSVANGAQFDTTTLGPHTFTATVVDSGTNNTSSTVTYNVVAPTDLAILNVGPFKAAVGNTLTYTIGVGDLGSANAVGVTVSDTIPSNTTLVSASGNNVSCAIVNHKLSCPTTPITCTAAGSTVTCPVANLAPLSLSSLNGATVQIKVLVKPAAAGTTLVDTATVSGSNLDSKQSNNSSTVKTSVSSH
jgi:uncharacterized repeat protein (TIGR01451 family)